jgi:uncharacterized protein (TIGR02145 family)
MTVGVAVSGVTQTITATVTTVGTYSISATANGVTFAAAGTFAATGAQNIVLTATGTPTAVGSNSFTLNTTPNCSFTRTTDAVVVPPPTNPIGAGTLSGKTCFDIALSNDNTNSCGPLSARTATQANFTQAATHTQSYTFTPSGTVSNVRFVYANTNGTPIIAISGGNTGNSISTAVVATVNYSTTLNTAALGLASAAALTADIYVIYNDGATNNGTDRQLKLTANIKDCNCCGAFIAPGVFKEFLCHNLGANTSLDPHNMAQTNAWGLNGAYIQWGKRGPNTTGDSRVDWITAASNGALGFAAAPTGNTAGTANSGSIAGWSLVFDLDNSWITSSGVKTTLDPCPNGYRVPSISELKGVNENNAVSYSGTWIDSSTNYNSAVHYGPDTSTKLLTLPAANARRENDGSLYSRGDFGYYWSNSNLNLALLISNGGNDSNYQVDQNYAISIRCIAE